MALMDTTKQDTKVLLGFQEFTSFLGFMKSDKDESGVVNYP
jgi:hypothetical protein